MRGMKVTQFETLRQDVDAFLERTGLAAARFGAMACGDRNLVFDLRKGAREFRLSTVQRVQHFMRQYEATAADSTATSRRTA